VFPAKSNPEFTALPSADAAAMGQYAGQQMTTGAQAKVYADNFISFHLSKMGGTYSQLSAASLAQPNNAKLAALVNVVFKGTTLRGLLLNAYAFWQMGAIALWGAIVSFIGAGLLIILSVLGFVHARWAGPATQILAPHPAKKQPGGVVRFRKLASSPPGRLRRVPARATSRVTLSSTSSPTNTGPVNRHDGSMNIGHRS
jgi:hypothetical protein